MTNSIQKQAAKASRAVTLRHYDAYDCEIFRPFIPDGSEGDLGENYIWGGVGGLDAEGGCEVGYNELGDCKMLMVGDYTPPNFNPREMIVELKYPLTLALIEPLVEPDDPLYYVPQKYDILYIDIGINIFIGFEIVDVVGDISVSPYTLKFVLNKRDELTMKDGKSLHP